MRTVIIILSITYSLNSFGQSDTLGISGNVYSCETNKEEFFARGLSICKDGNCEIVKVYSGGRFFIKNLSIGEYVIKYGNIWKQTLTDTIQLNEYLRGYKICIDKFQERASYPFLEMFNNSKSIKISQHSTGCFHNSLTEITFEKRDEYILATFEADEKVKSTKIKSAKQLALIQDFFSKIDLLDGDAGCTTTDDYTFKFDRNKLEIRDSTCDWNGFHNLMEGLF